MRRRPLTSTGVLRPPGVTTSSSTFGQAGCTTQSALGAVCGASAFVALVLVVVLVEVVVVVVAVVVVVEEEVVVVEVLVVVVVVVVIVAVVVAGEGEW